jgi:hypothetical protein
MAGSTAGQKPLLLDEISSSRDVPDQSEAAQSPTLTTTVRLKYLDLSMGVNRL